MPINVMLIKLAGGSMKHYVNVTDIAQEKTIENIELFRKESLKKTDTVEKNTLPTAESKYYRV